jgi:Zn-finger nucleic acid-binding protein
VQCPVDGTDLVVAERQGVEIERCPRCRGVWLDRNELDKIIDRTAGAYSRPPSDEYRSRRYPDEDWYEHPHGQRRRRGFLDDLFDID